MNSPNQDHDTKSTSTHEHARDAGFEMADDDPRRTDNRGGLAAIVDAGETASEENAADQGRDVSGAGNLGTQQSEVAVGSGVSSAGGAADTGQSTVSNQIDASATRLHAPKTGVPGVGELDSYASGATAPQVEMTDIGLVDVNSADMSVTGNDDTNASGDARVEGADGQPL
ncbi:MAG: hypothetical protein JWN98_2570 [Abditibacteriota bacterium]|nr:hypothetical protein [Abditibacteriota bacterium]